MKRTLLGMILLVTLFAFSSVAFAANIPIGFFSWDETAANSGIGAFNVSNETGANVGVFPDEFSVTTQLAFSDLAVHVVLTDGSAQDFGSSYFGVEQLGGGFNGAPINFGQLLPMTATLTGKYSPLNVNLLIGTSGTILEGFSATLVSSGSTGDPLYFGDLKIFEADFTPGTTNPVPEPGTWMLLGTGLASLAFLRRKRS